MCAAQKGRDGSESLYKGADALVIDSGANNEDELYCKSKALQTWLLGYEFTETVLIVCSRSIHVLTSKKKVPHTRRATTADPKKNHAAPDRAHAPSALSRAPGLAP